MTKLSTTILTVVFLITAAVTSFSQRLVSSSLNGSLTAVKVNDKVAELFGNNPIPPAASAVDLYKVIYTSTDESGRPTNLTGLVALPRNGAPKGLVVFCHGTIQDRKSAPSFWKGDKTASETAELAVLAFASGGYAIALPDYLGLGDDKSRAHPYPLSKVNARSAADIISPARTLAQLKHIHLVRALFVTGYSEGGGVAMALTQLLESKDNDYHVTASAPASGPYDLSGITREFMLKQPTDQIGFGARLYLLSYSTYYLRKNHNIKITDYFKPAMANSIWLNYNAGLKDETLITRLGITAVLMRSKNSIFNVITPRFDQAISRLDKKDPLVKKLIENNTYDWSPQTPMLLISLEGDAIVDPQNTEKAFRAMRGHGVGRNLLRRYVIRDPQLNHLTAVPAAMSSARSFFDNGFSGIQDSGN